MQKPELKRKLELDAFLYFNEYGNKKMNKIQKIDA